MDNNFNINDIMKMLSGMDKKELENGLAQASKVLNSPDADKIINQLKHKNNK